MRDGLTNYTGFWPTAHTAMLKEQENSILSCYMNDVWESTPLSLLLVWISMILYEVLFHYFNLCCKSFAPVMLHVLQYTRISVLDEELLINAE